jgi:uncharacterized protein YndB with AHSA1/START domain
VAVVERTIERPIKTVFAALIDPYTYPDWLVGAQEIRDVDASWPSPGSAFHHRVGLVGPLTVADLTKVIDIEEPRRLSLEVRARPLGRGRATFDLKESGSAGSHTVVQLDEVPIGLLSATRPLLDRLTAPRNRRSLTRLDEYLAQA